MKKKKVLYLTNIEVPYRVKFFNELAKMCDLTVMYERRKSINRNKKWSNYEKISYKTKYLDGINIGKEFSFSIKICSILTNQWDIVIVGCYNSKVQILAMIYMRILNIPFIINIDGEPFISSGIKAKIMRQILCGAVAYLCAGESACKSLRAVIGSKKPIRPYYFSSLTEDEIETNCNGGDNRTKTILVVGQYYDYKGMDVACMAACMDKNIHYKFVGMGNRTDLFKTQMRVSLMENVEVIPFLQKDDLMKLYGECCILLLPSRQECWGLVVNEAASFGMPIVSTWGSGAAVEFISDGYSCFLARPGDAVSLYECLKLCLESDNTAYSEFLKERSKHYSIEKSVECTIKLIKEICE